MSEEQKFARMDEVVMKKEELLQRLIQNKAKHDVVLAAAIAGYWDSAKSKVENRKTSLYKNLEEYKSDAERELDKILKKIEAKEELPTAINIALVRLDTSLGLSYPQDHSEDYNRVISMMQSSIYDEVLLTTTEYSQYILNNWTWKKEFIGSSTEYVNLARTKNLQCHTGSYNIRGYGANGANEVNGSKGAEQYYSGVSIAYNTLMLSGSAVSF